MDKIVCKGVDLFHLAPNSLKRDFVNTVLHFGFPKRQRIS